MIWKPITPVRSTLLPRKSVHDYGSDLALDFNTRDLIFENGDLKTVAGIDNFIQRVKTYLIEIPELLPTSTNEFGNQCPKLAEQLVNQKDIDPITSSTYGLGFSIEEIYSISLQQTNERPYLEVEMKVTGESDSLKITTPVDL